MKKIFNCLIISLFLCTSLNAMDYSKIIIGKWKDQDNEPLFEFFNDGKMTFIIFGYGKTKRKNYKYQVVGNELRYEAVGKSKKKDILIIDKYENGILYIYLKKNGRKEMGQLTRIKENQ